MATHIVSFNLERIPNRFVSVNKFEPNFKENKIYVDGVNLNGIVSRVHSLFEQKIYSNVAEKRRLHYIKRGNSQVYAFPPYLLIIISNNVYIPYTLNRKHFLEIF